MKSRMQETLPLIIHSSVSRLGKCSGLSHAGNPEVTAAADREYRVHTGGRDLRELSARLPCPTDRRATARWRARLMA